MAKLISYSSTNTIAFRGMVPRIVTVWARETQGAPPGLTVKGLPSDAAARELRVRVLSSLASIGIELDHSVSLLFFGAKSTAADLEIDDCSYSAGFDLAGAVAVLAHLDGVGTVPGIFVGELSLAGEVRPVRGVTLMLGYMYESQQKNPFAWASSFVVPRGNAAEARACGAPRLIGHLRELRDGPKALPRAEPLPELVPATREDQTDLATDAEERVLEIAAAGPHSVLFRLEHRTAVPFARALPWLLPTPTEETLRELSAIYSIEGLIPDAGYVSRRPFRAPHHTVSEAGIFGGGRPTRPGEVTLAHQGVLLLDETIEFRSAVLNGLRAVRTTGVVRRGLPAEALLVGTVLAPAATEHVRLTVESRDRYRDRIRALADLFDIVLDLRSAPEPRPLAYDAVRDRVTRAQAFEAERLPKGFVSSAQAPVEAIRDPVILRLARTIANLAGDDRVRAEHLEEAVALRHF